MRLPTVSEAGIPFPRPHGLGINVVSVVGSVGAKNSSSSAYSLPWLHTAPPPDVLMIPSSQPHATIGKEH